METASTNPPLAEIRSLQREASSIGCRFSKEVQDILDTLVFCVAASGTLHSHENLIPANLIPQMKDELVAYSEAEKID